MTLCWNPDGTLPDNVLVAHLSRRKLISLEERTFHCWCLIVRKFFLTLGQDILPGNFPSLLPALVLQTFGLLLFWKVRHRDSCSLLTFAKPVYCFMGPGMRHSLIYAICHMLTNVIYVYAVLQCGLVLPSFFFFFKPLSSFSQTCCFDSIAYMKWHFFFPCFSPTDYFFDLLSFKLLTIFLVFQLEKSYFESHCGNT